MARLAIDAMGGDIGPEATIAASVQALVRHPSLSITLVGDEQRVRDVLSRHGGADESRISFLHAPEQVEMDERPSLALRGKRDSSMRYAINLVKDDEADACVSAGNTGALMAMARFVLKTLPGVDRPAICGTMPGRDGDTHVLDLGANVDCSSEELFRFAVMGSALASAIHNIDSPKIALLNVGEEEIKGNDRVKQTAALLEASDLNYAGFVEGDDMYSGVVDVIVCDGFVGNVALKASEGVARMLMQFLKEEFSSGMYAKLSAMLAMPVLKAVGRRTDPRRYNGASLLGLKGIVVKSHGGADALSFRNAIDVALTEVEKAVPERIGAHLEAALEQREVI